MPPILDSLTTAHLIELLSQQNTKHTVYLRDTNFAKEAKNCKLTIQLLNKEINARSISDPGISVTDAGISMTAPCISIDANISITNPSTSLTDSSITFEDNDIDSTS